MKVAIILVSLFFVSCQTKTKTDIEYEKLEKFIYSEAYSASPVGLPVPPVVDSADIDWGAPESTCHH
jgi:hypothetical protein